MIAGVFRGIAAGVAIFVVGSLLMLATACTPPAVSSLPPAPAALAGRTLADEKALASLELAYQAAVKAVDTAIVAGIVTAASAPRVAEADRRAYSALVAARAAYAGANAADWLAAVASANDAARGLLAAIKGD